MKATTVALAVGLAAQTVIADSDKSCFQFPGTKVKPVGCLDEVGGCVQALCDKSFLHVKCHCPDFYPKVKCNTVCESTEDA
ncbi:hypothetical protein E4U54_004978 [Claviceps lovelessii]|nr:hypothetical protein E4U54_004978 [Claviceps lovelessii]